MYPEGVQVGNDTILVNAKTANEMTHSKNAEWLRISDPLAYAGRLSHMGTRCGDIQTFGEALADPDRSGGDDFAPDYTFAMAKTAENPGTSPFTARTQSRRARLSRPRAWRRQAMREMGKYIVKL